MVSKWNDCWLLHVINESILFYLLITQPVFHSCSFLFTNRSNNQPLEMWNRKLGSNLSSGGTGWLRWEHSLGPTELGTAGIQVGLWQGRLVTAKVVRKMVEKVWNIVQRYAGARQLEIQHCTSIWEHTGGEDWTPHSHFSVIIGEYSMDKVKKHNNQQRNMA